MGEWEIKIRFDIHQMRWRREGVAEVSNIADNNECPSVSGKKSDPHHERRSDDDDD